MESYAGFSFDELPEMSLALALTGLVDTGISGKRYLRYLEFDPESWRRLFHIL